MNDVIRKIIVKVREDKKPHYVHIGYRFGKRVVAYERHAHHPIDAVIQEEHRKRQWIRRWRHLWRAGYYSDLFIFGIMKPNFETWWSKLWSRK